MLPPFLVFKNQVKNITDSPNFGETDMMTHCRHIGSPCTFGNLGSGKHARSFDGIPEPTE